MTNERDTRGSHVVQGELPPMILASCGNQCQFRPLTCCLAPVPDPPSAAINVDASRKSERLTGNSSLNLYMWCFFNEVVDE